MLVRLAYLRTIASALNDVKIKVCLTAMHREGIITTRLDVKKGDGQNMRFSSSIEVDAPVNKVWALIDELEEWPQWMLSIRKIERVSEGPLTVGSQISVTAKVGSLSVTLLMTIIEFLPERSVVMQGKALGTNLTRFYYFEPVNGKTNVTLGGDVSGLLAWLARRGGQAVSDEMVQAVKKRIESRGT